MSDLTTAQWVWLVIIALALVLPLAEGMLSKHETYQPGDPYRDTRPTYPTSKRHPAWEQDIPDTECFEEDDMHTCPTCGDPMPESVTCHHHNTATDYDDAGNLVVQCEDCPEWWVVQPEVP